ncbi:type II toxin-antitoxin system Phd/YefM family antitoxin [Moorella sulfitireducens]|uniref:type II toxin-antitoxin system Phd/YefM family antitoxin n=1 Tax=Neomoorella sulfitireducens TaxID=2972948 RepID=UPI0021AC2E43
MRFVTVRELRMKSGEIWRQLQKEGELVITSNGKPVAVLSNIEEKYLEEYLQNLRRVRAVLAVKNMQARAREKGLDKITDAEIEAEIKTVRRSRSQ